MGAPAPCLDVLVPHCPASRSCTVRGLPSARPLSQENGINNPLLFFPIFYTIQEFLQRGTEARPLDGVRKYMANAHEDVPAIWSVWIPAQFINFGFSPMWFRVPFVAFVSAFWTAYVSMTRGSGKQSLQVVDGDTVADSGATAAQ